MNLAGEGERSQGGLLQLETGASVTVGVTNEKFLGPSATGKLQVSIPVSSARQSACRFNHVKLESFDIHVQYVSDSCRSAPETRGAHPRILPPTQMPLK